MNADSDHLNHFLISIFAKHILSKRLFPLMKKYVEGSNPKKSSGRRSEKFETARLPLATLKLQISHDSHLAYQLTNISIIKKI